jgi:predicted MarR family transcription regulator
MTEKDRGSPDENKLDELEHALTIMSNAYSHWLLRSMAAAGDRQLNLVDILVLHHLFCNKRPMRVTEICIALNISDTHTISYSQRKLCKLKLLESERVGKDCFYKVTESGTELCLKYLNINHECLNKSYNGVTNSETLLTDLIKFLNNLSGIYDQLSQGASLSEKDK